MWEGNSKSLRIFLSLNLLKRIPLHFKHLLSILSANFRALFSSSILNCFWISKPNEFSLFLLFLLILLLIFWIEKLLFIVFAEQNSSLLVQIVVLIVYPIALYNYSSLFLFEKRTNSMPFKYFLNFSNIYE